MFFTILICNLPCYNYKKAKRGDNVAGKDHGTCTLCGAEDVDLTIIDDVDRVCDECLDANYEQCEFCGEYWDYCYVDISPVSDDDDRFICEFCREELELEDEQKESEG